MFLADKTTKKQINILPQIPYIRLVVSEISQFNNCYCILLNIVFTVLFDLTRYQYWIGLFVILLIIPKTINTTFDNTLRSSQPISRATFILRFPEITYVFLNIQQLKIQLSTAVKTNTESIFIYLKWLINTYITNN